MKLIILLSSLLVAGNIWAKTKNIEELMIEGHKVYPVLTDDNMPVMIRKPLLYISTSPPTLTDDIIPIDHVLSKCLTVSSYDNVTWVATVYLGKHIEVVDFGVEPKDKKWDKANDFGITKEGCTVWRDIKRRKLK